MQLVGLGAVVIADIGLGRAEVHLDTAVRGHWEPRKRCCAVPLRAPSARDRARASSLCSRGRQARAAGAMRI